jgi:hypothetical protein
MIIAMNNNFLFNFVKKSKNSEGFQNNNNIVLMKIARLLL